MVPQLVDTLAGEAFQIRELRNELMLPFAATFTKLLNKNCQKRGGFVLRMLFYRSQDATQPYYKLQHTVMCLPVLFYPCKMYQKSHTHVCKANFL